MVVIPSDEDLVRLVVAGDASAFAELVGRHQRRIRTLCWRITGNSDESLDLTQETFLRVYNHRTAYQPGKPFVVWLQRICANVCLTHNERLRRRLPMAGLDDDDDSSVPAAPSAAVDPETRVSETDAADAVHRMVQALADPFRTTLVLRVFGGLSYQEIADELGCSLGTVMSRINRARMQLRSRLKDLSC